MTTTTQPTCEQRVEAAMASRLEDIRLLWCFNPQKDAKLDGSTIRIGDDIEIELRDEDLASDPDWRETHDFHITEAVDRARCEYGLSFDYVAPYTFGDQPEAYFRYQISYGGPSEEIRFYTNQDFSLHRAEFWFLDWFDGAHRDCTQDDAVQALWQDFAECETPRFAYDRAMH